MSQKQLKKIAALPSDLMTLWAKCDEIAVQNWKKKCWTFLTWHHCSLSIFLSNFNLRLSILLRKRFTQSLYSSWVLINKNIHFQPSLFNPWVTKFTGDIILWLSLARCYSNLSSAGLLIWRGRSGPQPKCLTKSKIRKISTFVIITNCFKISVNFSKLYVMNS